MGRGAAVDQQQRLLFGPRIRRSAASRPTLANDAERLSWAQTIVGRELPANLPGHPVPAWQRPKVHFRAVINVSDPATTVWIGFINNAHADSPLDQLHFALALVCSQPKSDSLIIRCRDLADALHEAQRLTGRSCAVEDFDRALLNRPCRPQSISR